MPAISKQPQGGPVPCSSRVKIGFAIGFTVGLVSGAMFGGFSAFRAGLRSYELLQSTGKTMITGGFTFGTFMAIGTAIRC